MPATTDSHLLIEPVGRVLVVSFTDAEILADEAIADVSDGISGLLDHVGTADVVIDFREVRHMSSALLAVLVAFERRLTKVGGRLKLCAIAPNLREVFKITRFDRLFAIHDDEAGALDAIEAAPLRRA